MAWSPPAAFPNLTAGTYAVTSNPTPRYNCIAWAAGENQRWWWPLPAHLGYWPAGAPRELTLSAFVDAFATLGYAPSPTGALEEGFEKVALFLSASGVPTHAARQLSNGRWTSKLGRDVDISHAVNGVDGPVYGTVAAFMARRSVLRLAGKWFRRPQPKT